MSKTWGFFFLGSGHGPESSCQISAYYKFFPGFNVFCRISTGLTVIFEPFVLPPKIFLLDLCLNFASVIFFITCVRVRLPTCKTKLTQE